MDSSACKDSKSYVIPLFLRTKLDEAPFHSEQKAKVHRVWFGGRTKEKRRISLSTKIIMLSLTNKEKFVSLQSEYKINSKKQSQQK